MIFLTLFFVGTVAAWLTGLLRGAHGRQDLALGAGGAFLLGGLAAGLAERSLGPFDPLVLGLGAVGGVAGALLDAVLERGANGRGTGHRREG